ncbi:hypothetical protein D9M72_605220 [compost metagenome]
MPSPSFASVAKFSSTRDTSHPASNKANDFALSATFIFSAPSASATSQLPALRCCTARCTVVLPDAQAFSTLNTGMPSIPILLNTTWPGIDNCP